MARFIGKDGVVTVDGTAVAQIMEFEFTDSRNVSRAVSMGDSFVGHAIGKPAYTGRVRCMLDTADAGQTAFKAESPIGLIMQPNGVGSGLAQWSFSAVYVSSIPYGVPAEEYATIEFEWAADSALDATPQV